MGKEAKYQEKLYYGLKINLSEYIFVRILIPFDSDDKILIEPGVRENEARKDNKSIQLRIK